MDLLKQQQKSVVERRRSSLLVDLRIPPPSPLVPLNHIAGIQCVDTQKRYRSERSVKIKQINL